MVPDERAKQFQQDYVNHMSKLYDELNPLAKTPNNKRSLRENWKDTSRLFKHLNAILSAKAKPRSMIAGPPSFPSSATERQWRPRCAGWMKCPNGKERRRRQLGAS